MTSVHWNNKLCLEFINNKHNFYIIFTQKPSCHQHISNNIQVSVSVAQCSDQPLKGMPTLQYICDDLFTLLLSDLVKLLPYVFIVSLIVCCQTLALFQQSTDVCDVTLHLTAKETKIQKSFILCLTCHFPVLFQSWVGMLCSHLGSGWVWQNTRHRVQGSMTRFQQQFN